AVFGAPAHRAGEQGPHFQGPFSHCRREDETGSASRALVLVRPRVSSKPERAAAHAARQRLAYRLPARLGCRSRAREKAREHHSARQGAAGQLGDEGRAVRTRMGQRLHLRLPAHGQFPPWPRAVRRRPGAPAADAPIACSDGSAGWLLRELNPAGFSALVFGDDSGGGDLAERSARAVAEADPAVKVVRIALSSVHELATQRYDARPGTVYLLRPDHHVCARWREPDTQAIRAALDHALAKA